DLGGRCVRRRGRRRAANSEGLRRTQPGRTRGGRPADRGSGSGLGNRRGPYPLLPRVPRPPKAAGDRGRGRRVPGPDRPPTGPTRGPGPGVPAERRGATRPDALARILRLPTTRLPGRAGGAPGDQLRTPAVARD